MPTVDRDLRALVDEMRGRDAEWQNQCDDWITAARLNGTEIDEATEASMRSNIYGRAAQVISAYLTAADSALSASGAPGPVAWRYRYEGGKWTVQKNKPAWYRPDMADVTLEPLYAHPQASSLGWQPIEAYDKERGDIAVLLDWFTYRTDPDKKPNPVRYVGYWSEEYCAWFDDDGMGLDIDPTHFMTLPAAPLPAQQEAGE